MIKWGHIALEYGLPLFSDHVPMRLTLKHADLNIKSPFRYFNVWANHQDFKKIVEDGWHKNYYRDPMQNVWRKLKMLRSNLRQLNNAEFKNISQKVEKARSDLKEIQRCIQQQYSDNLLNAEKQALQNLERWATIEEAVFKQKSRVNWLRLGDSNTK